MAECPIQRGLIAVTVGLARMICLCSTSSHAVAVRCCHVSTMRLVEQHHPLPLNTRSSIGLQQLEFNLALLADFVQYMSSFVHAAFI